MMAMKKREKILAIAVASLLVILAAVFLIAGSGSMSKSALRKLRDARRVELEKEKAKAKDAAVNAAKVRQWETQSLPSRFDIARSAYQNWLRALVEQHKFRDPEISSGEGQSRQGEMTVFPFRVKGRAGLEEITRFLYDFYSAPHLQQIRNLTITPLDGGKEFETTILIAAASLPTADRADTLSKANIKRLKVQDVDAYVKSINRRLMEGDRYVETGGLFAAYVPPPPPARIPTPKLPDPPKPTFDHLKRTILAGIVSVDDRPEVWLLVQTTGKRLTLGVGDEFEVGESRGKVLSIGRDEAALEIDGQRRTVKKGESLGASNP